MGCDEEQSNHKTILQKLSCSEDYGKQIAGKELYSACMLKGFYYTLLSSLHIMCMQVECKISVVPTMKNTNVIDV